jgi:predicted RNase H-like HicB family nuclease
MRAGGTSKPGSYMVKAIIENARKSYEATWAEKNFDKYHAKIIEMIKRD